MKQLVEITYTCPVKNCPNKFWHAEEWTDQDPNKILKLYCDEHQAMNYEKTEYRHRRSMTDLEKLKIGWYRDGKKWEDNIKSRKIVEKNGKRMVVSNQGVVPMQPRALWKKPKGQE